MVDQVDEELDRTHRIDRHHRLWLNVNVEAKNKSYVGMIFFSLSLFSYSFNTFFPIIIRISKNISNTC